MLNAITTIGALALRALQHPTDTAASAHTLEELARMPASALDRALSPVVVAALSRVLAASLPLGRPLPPVLLAMAGQAWTRRGFLSQGVVLPETDGSWSPASVSASPPPGGVPWSMVVHFDDAQPREGWLGDLELDIATASGPPRLYLIQTTRHGPLSAPAQQLWRPGLRCAAALAALGDSEPRPRIAALDTRVMPLASMRRLPADVQLAVLTSDRRPHTAEHRHQRRLQRR